MDMQFICCQSAEHTKLIPLCLRGDQSHLPLIQSFSVDGKRYKYIALLMAILP